MIYVTSDFHLFHNKEFIYAARGFSSVEEMNEAIVNNYKSVVTPNDDVYLLGDLFLGGNDHYEDSIKILSSLPGHIHIIRGNHDTNRRWSAQQEICTWDLWEVNNATYIDYQGYHFYLSHYPTITSNYDYSKPLKQRLLNICGHTHTKDKWCDFDKGYIYHAEVDAHDCKPVLLDDILQDFKKYYEYNQTQERQVLIDKKDFIADRNMFKVFTCGKCVWENECPGSPYTYPAHCPDNYTYKRDPPDGGYYG